MIYTCESWIWSFVEHLCSENHSCINCLQHHVSCCIWIECSNLHNNTQFTDNLRTIIFVCSWIRMNVSWLLFQCLTSRLNASSNAVISGRSQCLLLWDAGSIRVWICIRIFLFSLYALNDHLNSIWIQWCLVLQKLLRRETLIPHVRSSSSGPWRLFWGP